MKNLYLTMVPLALFAGLPASAQIDPGYRDWIPENGMVETIGGELANYVAVRVNPDGSRSYRLAEGEEITIDESHADADIVNLLGADTGP